MKVKHDFITNSSTSCYLVYIPESYKVTIKELQDLYNDKRNYVELYDSNGDEVNTDDLTDEMWISWADDLNSIVEDIKKGTGFDFESLSFEYDTSVTSFTHAVLEKFMIGSTEVSGGNSTIVIPLTKEDIHKISELDAKYEDKVGLCNKQL